MATRTKTIIPLPGRFLQPNTFWESLDPSEQELSVDRSISRLIYETTAYDVAGKTKDHWNAVIWPVVGEYLRINARKILRGQAWNGCVNCWMMGLNGSVPSPHIVITHLDEGVVKRYIKVLKRDQRVIATGFKLIGRRGNLTFIMYSSGFATSSLRPRIGAPSDFTGPPPTISGSLCGMRIWTTAESQLLHGVKSMILGGFVEVHGKTYTVLAAHPLLIDRRQNHEQPSSVEPPERTSKWIIDDGDNSDLSDFDGSEVSAESGTSVTEGPCSGSIMDAAFPESADTSQIFEHELVTGISSTPIYDPWRRSHHSGYYSKQWDWVLLPTSARPVNSFSWEGGTLYIRDIAVASPESEPLLMLLRDAGAIGTPRVAPCSGGLAMIQPPGSPAPIPAIPLDCRSGNVTPIMRELSLIQLLVKGNSGAWVVSARTGDLHGIVVATDEEAGITYMLRARDVLDDMRRVTNGDVKLPQSLPEPSTHNTVTRPSQVYSFRPKPDAQEDKHPRRRIQEIERLYKCGWEGCERSYETLNHLNAHVTMQSHGAKRTPEEFLDRRKELARKKVEQDARKREDEKARQAAEGGALLRESMQPEDPEEYTTAANVYVKELSPSLAIPCKFFRQGTCQAGNACPFSHTLDPLTHQAPCKYFSKGNCKFGAKCALAHYLPDGRRVNRSDIDNAMGPNRGYNYSRRDAMQDPNPKMPMDPRAVQPSPNNYFAAGGPLVSSWPWPPNPQEDWSRDFDRQLSLTSGPSESGHSNPFSPPFLRYPPVNPADQNPPCNTLYVGNLPMETSEDELKDLFSKQRGYKRLVFRTKQNGPMCLVEFEDISFATKALNELYGTQLHSRVKGGIRLSFSKNPLGVRALTPSAMGPMGVSSPGGVTPGGVSTAFNPQPSMGYNPLLRVSMPSAMNNSGNSSNISGVRLQDDQPPRWGF